MSSIQVQYDLSGWQALLCLMVGSYVDRDIVNHDFKSTEMVLILLSCVIAIGVNLCSFLLIGRTNAITYQVSKNERFSPSTPPHTFVLMPFPLYFLQKGCWSCQDMFSASWWIFHHRHAYCAQECCWNCHCHGRCCMVWLD